MKLTLDNLHLHATEDEGGCLLWNHSVNSRGYPQACLDGKPGQLVRRYVYELANGRIKGTRVVRCWCDQKLCITPGCLYVRTRTDMAKDQYRECKSAEARRNRAAALDKGRRVKLTPQQVLQVRVSMRPTNEIAEELGVSTSTVRRIRNGTLWNVPANASVFTWRPAA